MITRFVLSLSVGTVTAVEMIVHHAPDWTLYPSSLGLALLTLIARNSFD